MNDYVITTCSSADMPESFYKERNVGFAMFHFIIDGRDYLDDLGKTIPFKVFYDMIKGGATPTTSQPSVSQYIELFEPYVKENKKILHIALSSGISGAYNSACTARDQVLEKYPDAVIHICDSLAASGGQGLLVDKLCDLRDSGKSFDYLVDWVEKNKLHVQHWFYSTDLTSFYRGGRISKTSHVFGTLLNICPLMNVNNVGKLMPREKYRGKKKVMLETLEKMKLLAEGGVSYSGKCFITQADFEDDAKQLAGLIEQTFPTLNGKVHLNSIGNLIGSHTGPGTIALFFFGDLRED